MKNYLFLIASFLLFTACGDGIPQEEKRNAWWLDEADLSVMEQDWAQPNAGFSCDSNELSIAGKTYDRGVGTHAISKMMIDVKLMGKRIKGPPQSPCRIRPSYCHLSWASNPVGIRRNQRILLSNSNLYFRLNIAQRK